MKPTARPVIETLATGDEVVAGDVLDSNGAFLARQLTARGLLVSRHTALPDDAPALAAGMREIAERADLCITCGGLGPTEDDLTVEVVAGLLQVPVQHDEMALARMQQRFARAGYRFSSNNARSARVPAGSTVHQNEVGTAPAFSVMIERCRFFFLPGVPKEFRDFVARVVLPWVDQRWPDGFGAVRQLKTLGWGESHLAERFEDYPTLFPQVKVGYRAHSPEVWLKLSVTAADRATALATIEPALTEARRRLGPTVFGLDDETLEGIVHVQLVANSHRLALAESCTGGLATTLLAAQPGASHYLRGTVIAYADEGKRDLLGVAPPLLATHGAVSREVAVAMVMSVRERFAADLALAITGVAGPSGGSDAKPVGTVYLALATPGGAGAPQLQCVRRHFRGDRERVQRAAALTALEMLRRWLLHLAPLPEKAV